MFSHEHLPLISSSTMKKMEIVIKQLCTSLPLAFEDANSNCTHVK